MITSISAFQEQTSNINSHLFYETNDKITYIKREKQENNWAKDELLEWYNNHFKSFPLFTIATNDEVVVSHCPES